MTTLIAVASPEIADLLGMAKRFPARERLVLAKLLLDSVVSDEVEDELDWQALGVSAFEKDWDNSEDAIYDNWREIAVGSPEVSVQRLKDLLPNTMAER